MHISFHHPGSAQRSCIGKQSPTRRGAALVIVLAFVVLLTGLIVAFFSRAMSERQVSNSSASQTRVEVFAQGAQDMIVGDLKQEIVVLSNTSTVTAGSLTTTIYLPKTSANMRPSLAGSSGTGGLENLIKVSGTTAPYTGGTTRACSASTTGTSLNGRFFTAARWNKALLMPVTGTNDYTPKLTSGTFTPPNWILVGRDGSNPTAVTSSTAANYVIGRYAYAIYDEGGLLDANVAGYPSTSSTNQSAYKPALAYADLTQIGLTQPQIDQLVGWRNYASTQAPGTSFTSPNFTTASGTNYAQFVISNTTGFLTTGTAINNNQTDRMFTSRQELLRFLQNGVGLSATSQAFQCLGSFSRDVNQPSLVPALSYDSSAPKILAWTSGSSSGGNDKYKCDALTLVTGSSDGRVNPSFLGVRVRSSFTRNDGSQAVVGEPLVKKRFNLSRLAWLTYLGPSQTRNITNPGSSGQDSDMYTLENSYAISQSWLQQGTATNVKNYFGLTWNIGSNYWVYDHGMTGVSSLTPVIGTLDQVAAAGREPDFFELLKASINAGALGKTAVSGTTGVNITLSPNYSTDSSVDYAILQIGANIIDQFDADGYPTDIHWVNGGNKQDFVGVENLPYLNRMRAMIIKAREAAPVGYGINLLNDITQTKPNSCKTYYNDGSSNPNTLTDTGVGILMWYPEIWNPHDGNSANLNQTFGTPAPTNFQILGISYVNGLNNAYVLNEGANAGPGYAAENIASADTTLSPKFTPDFSFTAQQGPLTESNTQMTFSVSSNAAGASLFREPTLLFRPNVPSGSSLAAPGLNSVIAANTTLKTFKGGGGGILRSNTSSMLDQVLTDPLTQDYIGFYVGAVPLRYVVPNLSYAGTETTYVDFGPTPPAPNTPASYIFTARGFTFATAQTLSLRTKMQFQDASNNWVTYDEKYGESPGTTDFFMGGANNGFFNPYQYNGSPAQPPRMTFSAPFDARSGRFGLISSISYNHTSCLTPFRDFIDNTRTEGWVNQSDGTTWSHRMGKGSGMALAIYSNGLPSWEFPSSIGWYPGASIWGSKTPLRVGLFEQNSPLVSDDGFPVDDDSSPKTQDFGATYPLGGPTYYSDADGVVRRGAGAWVSTSANAPTITASAPSAAPTTVGLPLAPTTVGVANNSNRPIILNRPFRSVGDLGYVFSGTPFKNLDFYTPESGYAGLLDVFCINDTNDANGLTAGKVNLNTGQAPVLQAILAGAYKDEWNAAGTTIPGGDTSSLAYKIAKALVTRTQNTAAGKGPLRNVSELVGRWVSQVNAVSGGIDGSQSYDGFSADLQNVLTSGTDTNIQRFREAPMRALANCGQTRVWNLMIDLVAQTGRYPASATASTLLDNFVVEGEQRRWVHVAIDRYTGQILDLQIETVNE